MDFTAGFQWMAEDAWVLEEICANDRSEGCDVTAVVVIAKA